MIDLIVFNVVAAAAAVTWGLALRPRPLALAPMTVALLHVLIVQVWVLGSGVVGLLDVWGWRAAAALVGLYLLDVWIHHRRVLGGEAKRWARRIGLTLGALGGWRAAGVALLLGAMAGWVAAVGVLVGPYLPDVTSYHLVPPTDWVVEGRIAQRQWMDPRVWWPQGHGLLTVWWMLPSGHVRAAVGAELQWIVLAWAAAWAWARALGAAPRSAAAASVLVGAVPVVWAHAVGGLNDLAVSVLTLTALAALAGGSGRSGRYGRRGRVALALIALALGAGVKPTMLLIAPAVGALALWRWARSGLRFLPGASGAARHAWVWAVALAILVGCGWYARNALVWRNPIYPSGASIGGVGVLAGSDQLRGLVGTFGWEQMRQNVMELVTERMWDLGAMRAADTLKGTGFGLTAVGLGVAAMAGLLIGGPRGRGALAALLVGAAVLAAGVQPDPWNGRFFSFIALAGVGCAAAVTPRLRPRAVRGVWLALLVLTGAASFGLGAYRAVPYLARVYWQEHGIEPVPPEALAPFTPRYHVLASVRRHVPAEATLIVVAPDHHGPAALLHGPRLGRRLVYHRGTPDAQQIGAWRRRGLRWVCTPVPFELQAAMDRLLTLQGLRPVAEGVYEIPGS